MHCFHSDSSVLGAFFYNLMGHEGIHRFSTSTPNKYGDHQPNKSDQMVPSTLLLQCKQPKLFLTYRNILYPNTIALHLATKEFFIQQLHKCQSRPASINLGFAQPLLHTAWKVQNYHCYKQSFFKIVSEVSRV